MNSKLLLVLAGISSCYAADILMITMGGTKSHKIPFLELAKGLMPRCVCVCVYAFRQYEINFILRINMEEKN